MKNMELIQNISEQVSTVNPPRKEQDPPSVVRFDPNCTLCKMLANFMQQRVSIHDIVFVASDAPSPDQLVVEACDITGSTLFSGADAWQWLLERHPVFKEINWVAQRLGIASAAAASMSQGGHLLRKFCFRCR
jgi:predicted DCC family thiol-disulfide oxidoreductase YuxK